MTITETSANRRIKPTLDTSFHVDYDWWTREDRNLRAYLINQLPPEQQEYFSTHEDQQQTDWIDPETAQVRRVDGLQMALQEAAKSESFIKGQTSTVDSIFRVFLANGNTPQTPRELGQLIGRAPEMILRTLSGATVYKGIRPLTE